MSDHLGHESISLLLPTGASEANEYLESPTENPGYQTMVVVDYDKPLDHPERFTAVLITPEQLDELGKTSDAGGYVQYTEWQKNSMVFSVPLSTIEAKPLFLAKNSSLRGSAATEELAVSAALNSYISHLGEMVLRDSPAMLYLQ